MKCENCGKELNDGLKFCPVCGTPVENHHAENEMENDETSQSNTSNHKKKTILLISVVAVLAVVICVVLFVVRPQMEAASRERQSQEQVEQVIQLIDRLSDEEITVDSEAELNSIQNQYDELTDEQKALVTNYQELEDAFASLQAAKDEQKNVEAAERVINLINSLDEKEITVDSEADINAVQLEYDALSQEQKELVSNYSKLEQAHMDLQIVKNQADVQTKAAQVIQAIEQINEAELTAEDTSVESVRAQYNALSEEGKALVTNLDKLERCEQTVSQKRQEQEEAENSAQSGSTQAEKWWELDRNIRSYEGTWGNFGAHVDYYQGVVEQAIKNTMSMSDYFAGDPNDVYISVYKESAKAVAETDPVCYIELNGSKELYYDESGQIEDRVGLHIWGGILVDENANVIFEIYDMQEAG